VDCRLKHALPPGEYPLLADARDHSGVWLRHQDLLVHVGYRFGSLTVRQASAAGVRTGRTGGGQPVRRHQTMSQTRGAAMTQPAE
jgi:hypothetical protein